MSLAWYRYLAPLFFWLRCPACNGAGGFEGGSIPDAEPWDECSCCYRSWMPLEDHGAPEWVVGRLPVWRLGRYLSERLIPCGGWTPMALRYAILCRLGIHDPGDLGTCRRCYVQTEADL